MSNSNIDKTWHLASSDDEIKITESELQLWRVFYGFVRWQEDCEKNTNGTNLTANDLAVLHTIRMKNRPKTIYDVGRLLNRSDTYNIYYSVRRLLKLKLVEMSKSSDKKMKAYQITELGIKNTDAYTRSRKAILVDMFIKETNLDFDQLSKTLATLKAIYDEADRTVASYIIPVTHEDTSKKK